MRNLFYNFLWYIQLFLDKNILYHVNDVKAILILTLENRLL